MKAFRFMNRGREVFGTSVLQMNQNTILRLCRTNKYHFSLKQHNTKVESFNQIVNQLTQKLQTAGVNCVNELKDINSEDLEIDNLVTDILSNMRLVSEISSIRTMWEMSKTQCLSVPCHHLPCIVNN